MPKPGKELRPSSRHSGGRLSPPRQSRNDYQIAGSSRSISGRRSPNTKDNIKKSNGRPGNLSNRMHMSLVNSPIILIDDDDDDDNVRKNLDTSMNMFRENGNKLKPDTGEGATLVKHFVPSADRYHMSQSTKPVFRGPETDVLHNLGNDKLKIIRVQMIRADIQQNDSFRKTYVVEDPVAGKRSEDKNHKNFEERQINFNRNNQQIHYDNNDKSYGIVMSPTRSMPCGQSLVRSPSPPLSYFPERDHFNSDNNMLRRDRPKHSPERNVHDRLSRPEHFTEQFNLDNIFSSPSPEPRSSEMQRFRPGDHNRHCVKDDPVHYEERPRHSGSPVYFENHYQYNRSMSPNNRSFSLDREEQLPITPPSLRELSSPLRDRPQHSIDRPRRRRTPPRRNRSRERRRRFSPRRRTPPPVRSSPVSSSPVHSSPVHSPPACSPLKRREKRGSARKERREVKERKKQSQSMPKQEQQQQQQQQENSFQQPQPQPMYMRPPPPPPPVVVRMPPRPFPPGPMMIPIRPPPYPPPMGAWRPPRPPMQAPPSGWPYPRPRPFYYPY